MRTAAIILAAGCSSRMGTPKQLLAWDGRTLLRQAVERALASICNPVYVVIGANAAKMREHLADLPVRVVENSRWAEGMGSSIVCGVTAVMADEPAMDAAALLLADQPNLDSAAINLLVDAADNASVEIVASSYAGTLGAPAIFKRSLFGALCAMPADDGAKKIIASHRDRVLAVPMPQAEIDIDTPEQYKQGVMS